MLRRLFPQYLWRVDTVQPEIYLTFDDGPVNGPTGFVLDVLADAGARGTFFCIGDNVRKHPAVFQRIVDEGHTVGNHTFNHLNGWKTSTDAYIRNVDLFDEQMRLSGGPAVKLFRPPYGRITRMQSRVLMPRRTVVMWDVVSWDFNSKVSPEQCLKNTLRAIRPGSIVVFHDSFKAERNLIHALPRIVEYFSEKGFRFKALPQ